jgi:hypothetical protein
MENMMTQGIRSYGPGKFSTILDGFVYELALDGVDDEISLGEGQGWYGFLEFDEKTAKQVRKLMATQHEPDEPTEEEEKQLTFASAVILYERSDGIVETQWFDNPEEATEEWKDIVKEFEGEEDDEEEEEPEEEEEEDDFDLESEMEDALVVGDSRNGYSVSFSGKHIGDFDDFDEALTAGVREMHRSQYFPNVFYVNERGNTDLLTVNYVLQDGEPVDIKSTTVRSWV